MSNIQIAAKAEILGTPVQAGFLKRETKDTLKIDQKEIGFNVSEEIMLVYGKPEIPLRKSLSSVLQELTFGKWDVDSIRKQLPEVAVSMLDGIDVSVNHVYFVKTARTLKDDDGEEKISENLDHEITKEYLKAKNNTFEYALWIDINVKPELMEQFPVKVTNISVKVWSTDNEKVLEEMKIKEVETLMANAGLQVAKPLEQVDQDDVKTMKPVRSRTA